MRLKLKQSNNSIKSFLLPPIHNSLLHRYTPLQKHNNHSSSKITTLLANPDHPTHHPKSKAPSNDKRQMKDRIKAVYQQNKKQQSRLREEESSPPKQSDDANITTNFKKQIERNLILIKKQKQNKRVFASNKKMQNQSPRKSDTMDHSFVQLNNRQNKCVTEGEIFNKINEIIAKSQSKSKQTLDDKKGSYSSSMLIGNTTDHYRKNQNHKIKTDGVNSQTIQNRLNNKKMKRKIESDFKHAGNYNEWRRMSIDSQDSGKISYDVSSYDLEADRVEKIRGKNDLTLKKYFQGKFYLNRLIKCRQSTILTGQKRDS